MSSRPSWRDRLIRQHYLLQLLLRFRSHNVPRELWAASLGWFPEDLDRMLQLLRAAPAAVVPLAQLSRIPAPEISRRDVLRFRLACARHWFLQLAEITPPMPL